jgi:hypothetical protein
MTVNVSMFPVDGDAVVYFQDGTSITVKAQTTKEFQIIDDGFCTISDAPGDEDESPPFVEAMIEFWQEMAAKIREEINEPEVNPL